MIEKDGKNSLGVAWSGNSGSLINQSKFDLNSNNAMMSMVTKKNQPEEIPAQEELHGNSWMLDLNYIVAPNYLYRMELNALFVYFQGKFIDRTETIDPGFNQIVDRPIPTGPYSSPDFDEVVYKTCKDIEKQSKEKGIPIAVLWSGGMDSTVVALGLQHLNIPFTLVYNDLSTQEHLWLWLDVFSPEDPNIEKIKIEKPLEWMREHAEDYITITGECGSSICGTFSWFNFGDGGLGTTDNQNRTQFDILADQETARIFKNPEPLYGIPQQFKDLLMPVVEKCPVDFKYNYDYLWWVMFAMKQEWVNWRMTTFSGVAQPNLINFFINDDWDQWALSNDSRVKCPLLKWENFKMPWRDFIYKHTGNSAAYQMLKIRSMPMSHPEITRVGGLGATRAITRDTDGKLWIEEY